MRAPPIILLGAILTFSIADLFAAAQRTWTGNSATSGNWTTAVNWDNNIAPVPGDFLVIGAPLATRFIMTNNFPSNTVFGAIAFLNANYNVYGNAITITNYISVASADTITFRPDIRLGRDAIIAVGDADGVLSLLSDIDLNSRDLEFQSAGSIVHNGAISGTGDITKSRDGELTFSGLTANTYFGEMSVEEGTLRLNKITPIVPTGRISIPGRLTIGNGTVGPVSATVMHSENHQIANTSPVEIRGSGRLDLNGYNDTIGALTLLGGQVVTIDGTNAGTLTLNGDVSVVDAGVFPAEAIISGRLNPGTGPQRIFNVEQDARLRITASVSGDGDVALVKTNFGDFTLASSNSYGGLTIVGGTFTVSHANALGSPTNGTKLAGSTLVMSGPLTISSEPLLAEDDTGSGLAAESGNCSWNGPIVIDGAIGLFVVVRTNITLNLNGAISGSSIFAITKSDTGTLRFAGIATTNTFIGVVEVAQGELQLNKIFSTSVNGRLIVGDSGGAPKSARLRLLSNHQIGDFSRVTVGVAGVLQMNDQHDLIGTLDGVGPVELGAGKLTVGSNIFSSSFVYAGVISGTGDIEKVGNTTMTLSSNHTFTGETRVSGGTLRVNGSIQPSSDVLVNGGTLGGTGFVPEILVNAGVLDPGTTNAGVLTSTGGVTLTSNSTFRVRLNGPAVGTGYDQLLSLGVLQLGDSTLDVSLGFTPAASNTFRIIDNFLGGPVQRTFKGLPQGAVFSVSNVLFQIDYTGGNGNDVVIKPVFPVSFNTITPLGTNQLKLEAHGVPGAQYIIQATPHLNTPIPWMPISTNTADGAGLIQFTNMDSLLYPMRFYRIATP